MSRPVFAFVPLFALLAACSTVAQTDAESRPGFTAAKGFPYEWRFPQPPAGELKSRRAALARRIRDGVAIVMSIDEPSLYSGARSRPANNIYYLTGVETSPCILLLVAKDGAIARESLYLPKYDRQHELWNGVRTLADAAAKAATGVDDVVEVQGSMQANSVKPFVEALAVLAKDPPGPFFLDGKPFAPTKAGAYGGPPATPDLRVRTREDGFATWVAALNPDAKFRSLGGVPGKPENGPMASIRGVKSAWEIEQIRRAVHVTGAGFARMLRSVRPGMWEFELDAVMQGTFLEFGATGVPYYPIVGSGPNSCFLHYSRNRRQLEDGDIVLTDVAAEWGWYAADVTRTFPANGKFTPRQKLVYEAVLAGQEAAAAMLKPGVTLAQLDRACRDAMRAAGLKDIEQHPHGLGHMVGLAVHDFGDHVYEPGMVLTIEPGSYLAGESLGVRIEDVYLVTENGAECLSKDIPKTVAEIEALIGADRRTK